MRLEFDWDPAKAASNLAKHIRNNNRIVVARLKPNPPVVPDVARPAVRAGGGAIRDPAEKAPLAQYIASSTLLVLGPGSISGRRTVDRPGRRVSGSVIRSSYCCACPKHKISFDEAMTVFLDPLAISRLDDDNHTSEERWITVGLTPAIRLVLVVHTYIEQGHDQAYIRIISAGPPTKREKGQYEQTQD